MPIRPFKCKVCAKAWLAEFDEGTEEQQECPNCGIVDSEIFNALVTSIFTVNDKKVQVDFPTEVAVGIVAGFYTGMGPQGLTVVFAGETHSWPWGTFFKRMGLVQ